MCMENYYIYGDLGMNEKRFKKGYCCGDTGLIDSEKEEWFVENINSISDLERNWNDVLDKLNEVADENEQLKNELERCKDWINSDKYDYELTLAFIKNKGYSLKDVLEYEKELKDD